MSEPAHDLERLISRHLDDECTSRERRELNARLRRDSQAAALFEEHRALDREIKHALRSALSRSPLHHPAQPMWERTARVFVVAAAACLAAMFWFAPDRDTSSPRDRTPAQARSWFTPPSTWGDVFTDEPTHTPLRGSDANWIVVPTDTPREFLVIEVNRARARVVVNHQDF